MITQHCDYTLCHGIIVKMVNTVKFTLCMSDHKKSKTSSLKDIGTNIPQDNGSSLVNYLFQDMANLK